METTQVQHDALRLVIGTARQFVRTADRVMPRDEEQGAEDWQAVIGERLQDLEEVLDLYSKVSEEIDEQRLRELLEEFRDRRAQIRWAQSRLGLVANGRWSLRSRAMCVVFQTRHGLPATGELDAETTAALAQYTTPNTPPIIV